MKKKLVTLTLSLALALSLVACGEEEKKTETAKTDATKATTETSVTSTEKTEEVAPVAEESEQEVVEEVQEEIVEEKLPTTTEEIENYFHENGKIGDYIISEDGFLTVKIEDTYSRTYPVTMINNEMYVDTEKNVYGYIRAPQLSDSGNINTHTYYRDPNHDNGYYDRYVAIKEKLDNGIYASFRVEPTNDPNLIKITYILPEGTIDWINNDVSPLNIKEDLLKYTTYSEEPVFDNWLFFSSDSNALSSGVYIPINELKNDTITFIAPRNDLLPQYAETNTQFNEKWLTPEILTALVFHSRPTIFIKFETTKNTIEQYSNYTLVTD